MKKMVIILLFLLWGMPYGMAETEIERLKEYAQTEQMKEEENRLAALELERMRLELEKKKLLTEMGALYSPDLLLTTSLPEDRLVNVRLLRIIDTPLRKEVTLSVDGEIVTLKDKEQKGALCVQEILPSSVKIEYHQKQITLDMSL